MGDEEERPIKFGRLEKRSQNRSFFKANNYMTRLFVLKRRYLKYFEGSGNSKVLKRTIDLRTALVIEPVVDGALDGKTNVFQITYTYTLDGEPITLYAIAASENDRHSWISAIRLEAQQNGAILLPKCHAGAFINNKLGYTCCDAKEKGALGCTQSSVNKNKQKRDPAILKRPGSPSGMSITSMGSGQNFRLSNLLVANMMKRARAKGNAAAKDNFQKRTFVLDSNSLRYYEGDIRQKKNEKGRVHLSCVVTVEPLDVPGDEGKTNVMFQVGYYEDQMLVRLYVMANNKAERDKWVRAVKAESIAMGAEFTTHYHPEMFDRKTAKWTCCPEDRKGKTDQTDEGCRKVQELPEMKFCGGEMTEDQKSMMSVDHTAKQPDLLMASPMLKRSQEKSFFTSKGYTQRVFMLDTTCLAYYTGYGDEGGVLKGWVPFVDMVVVECVTDGSLDDKENVFQVGYYENSILYYLYIVANSDEERREWITNIKKEVVRSRVSLQPRYHPGAWTKALGKYTCCGNPKRDAIGCREVHGMSMTSVRSRSNTMDSYRQATTPENKTMSPRYQGQNRLSVNADVHSNRLGGGGEDAGSSFGGGGVVSPRRGGGAVAKTVGGDKGGGDIFDIDTTPSLNKPKPLGSSLGSLPPITPLGGNRSARNRPVSRGVLSPLPQRDEESAIPGMAAMTPSEPSKANSVSGYSQYTEDFESVSSLGM